jgi:hypothetical protein
VSAPHTYFELPSWSASPVLLNVTESCTGCGCGLAGGLGGVFTGTLPHWSLAKDVLRPIDCCWMY